MLFNPKHKEYMKLALKEAQKAYEKNEVPVGCVIANNEEILSQSHNEVEKLNNPLMHAELIAINNACLAKGSKFLEDYNIYVTLEPCSLCLEAISMVRIKKIFFATSATKTVSQCCKTQKYEGLMEEESKELLQSFFQTLRKSD
jgi:tRNA(Arg) A34 adenosine deaminase TadA